MFHGIGTLSYPKNSNIISYSGQWNFNQRTGQGVLIWRNKQRYEGSFLKDKMHGLGMKKTPEGKTIRGLWASGKLIKEEL